MWKGESREFMRASRRMKVLITHQIHHFLGQRKKKTSMFIIRDLKVGRKFERLFPGTPLLEKLNQESWVNETDVCNMSSS